jgi:hypothetical protein
MEFRQYPPLVDNLSQYPWINYPHDIHNLWITFHVDKVIQSENTNIISNNYNGRNAFS